MDARRYKFGLYYAYGCYRSGKEAQMRTRKLLSVLAISMILLGACAAPSTPPVSTPTPVTSPPPTLEETELKHDDGTSEGTCSAGSHIGFLVHFTPLKTPFVINKVKVFTILKGTGYENQTAWFEIWDGNNDVLHYWQFLPVHLALSQLG